MNKIFRIIWSKALQRLVVVSELATSATSGRGARSPNTRQPRSAIFMALGLSLATSAAGAVEIQNASFEDGTLSGWTAGGGTGSQASGSYSSTGVGASVVTGMTDFDSQAGNGAGVHSWTVTPYGAYMASLQAGPESNNVGAGMTALGLTAASQSAVGSMINGTLTNAAWLYQDLALEAGDSFTMAWQYVSTDYQPFNDASFTSLVNLGDSSILGTVNNQDAQFALLGATNLGTGSYSTGSYGATGWQVATYSVITGGTYRLGFLTFNLNDQINSPVLLLDQQPGLTFDKGVPFGPVAPNPGTGAPTTPSGPTAVVIEDTKGTDDLGDSDTGSFEGGTLVVDADTTVDQDFTIAGNGGTIDQNGKNSTFDGVFSDADDGAPGSLTIVNSDTGGSVTLTGANTYTGTTTIDDGATLALAGDGSITGSDVVANGTFDITGANDDVDVQSLGGTGTVELGTNDLVLTDANGDFGGTIGGTGGVTVEGGTQTLSGTNTYTGTTTIDDGATLALAGDGSITGSDVVANGTFDITGANDDVDVQSLGGTGTVELGTNDLVLTDADGDFGGTIGGTGGVTVEGGTQTLSGTNTYTGTTTIDDGATLALAGDGSITGSDVVANGTFDITGANDDVDVQSLGGTGTVELGTNDLVLTDANGDFGGTIGGTGGVTVEGGTQTLSGTNTYTGTTTIDDGATLQIDRDANLGDASGDVALNGGTLHTTDDVTTGRDVTLTGTGTFDTDAGTSVISTGEVAGNGTLVKDGEGTLTLEGVASHTGGTVVEDGTLVLSGENTYTGGTSVNAGSTLQIDRDANLGDDSGDVALNGGMLRTTGDVTTGRDVTLTGFGVFDTGTGTTLDLSGTVSGNGAVVKTGQGTLVLSAANGYTGGTYIHGGTLQVEHSQALGTGGLYLRDSMFSSLVDLNLAGPVQLAGNTAMATGAGTTTELAGIVDGTAMDGCFIKSGAGRMHLTGSATMANGTCVTEGELQVDGMLASRVQVDRPATLSGTGAIRGAVDVVGTLAPSALGTLAVEGDVTMHDGSTLRIDIDGTGTAGGAGGYSRVVLLGADSVFTAAGTLRPVLTAQDGTASGFAPVLGDMFRIVSAEGGVVGRFDALEQPVSGLAAGTRLQAFYKTGHDIDLYVTPVLYRDFLGDDANGNTQATADVIDRLVSLHDPSSDTGEQAELLRRISAADGDSLPAVIAGLTGETHAQLASLANERAVELAGDVSDRLGEAVLGGTGADSAQRLWATVSRSDRSIDADAASSGFHSSHDRISAGIDLHRGAGSLWGVGLASANSELGHAAGSGEVRGDALMLYGAFGAGRAVVDSLLTWGDDHWTAGRRDVFDSAEDLRSAAHGTTLTANVGVRMPMQVGGMQLEPFARASWHSIQRDAFVESGDSVARLQAEGYDGEGARVLGGVNLGSRSQDPLSSRTTYRVGVAVGADYGDARDTRVTTVLAGQDAVAASPDGGGSFVMLSASGTLRLGRQTYLYGGVSSEKSGNRDGQVISAGIRVDL